MVAIDLSERRTVVIGGARGIGAAIARVVGEAASRVAWIDLKPCPEQEKALARLGVETFFQALDCTDADGTRTFIDSVAEMWGGVDHLVYSAGFTSPVSFLDLTPGEWRRIVDINLNGAFFAVRTAGGAAATFIGLVATGDLGPLLRLPPAQLAILFGTGLLVPLAVNLLSFGSMKYMPLNVHAPLFRTYVVYVFLISLLILRRYRQRA